MNELMPKLKIKKGDTVVVRLGKDRGKQGLVLAVSPREERLVVDGVNMAKKHVRARRAGEKGQRVTAPAPVHVSNVQLVCPACKRGSRVRIEREDGAAKRTCVRCQGVIPNPEKK